MVAVKVIRSVWDRSYLERLNTRLLREARVWSQLKHPNITPFYGITFDLGVPSAPCLVSPYYANGSLFTYLKNYPDCDKMALIRQIAAGLSYLHQHDVVHGDIKTSNILVNDQHEASISDFGLSRILEYSGFTTKAVGGTCRWMAAELIDPEEDDGEPALTTATDVWAFGMTVLEILSGKLPFYWIKYDTAVILLVMRDGRPARERYPTISNAVWGILESCWRRDPEQRPGMRAISQSFGN
ncbi:kinase-like protein [Athelia psychrophila]|uniref:Kinase-like protein n=1 Tax=Athelia psychrophila TaxID=1759441 RepID=A0A166RPZ2_9AGAM|nr:kinase-like protein [Fibularhizoctonia sp. CBS 109695]